MISLANHKKRAMGLHARRIRGKKHFMSESSPNRTDDSLIALRRILRATELYERSLARGAGLTSAQLRVLQLVAGQREVGITPKQLAVRMGVSQATVTTLVDKLVNRRMVTRIRSDMDRRQTNVVITPEGSAAVATAPDALQQRFVKAFEALEDWEQAMLVASLERVATLLNATGMDASPVLTIGDIHSEEPKA